MKYVKSFIPLILLFITSIIASGMTTSFLVDVSGSVNGMSKDRAIQSLGKIKGELNEYVSHHKTDSIQIITYTDKIIESVYATAASPDINGVIDNISFPRKGNTNINVPIDYLNNSDVKAERLVIISDGKHNVSDYSKIVNDLKSNHDGNNIKQYFLLLDESDLGSPLVKEFSKSDYIKIIRSLSELSDENANDRLIKSDSLNSNPTQKRGNKLIEKSETQSIKKNHVMGIPFWIIISLILLFCVFLAIESKKNSSPTRNFFNVLAKVIVGKPIIKSITNTKISNANAETNSKHYSKTGPSELRINPDYTMPNGSQHKNPSGKTNRQLLEELNDTDGKVKLDANGNPLFDKDGGTKDGKSLSVELKEGIRPYLKEADLQRGKNIDRSKLHNEVFRRMAKKYNMSEDELQVFKGNSAPVESLMKKWNCSEQDVYERCRNPHRIARVLHECADGKTVQLVPWVYHHIPHSGGIEAVVREVK